MKITYIQLYKILFYIILVLNLVRISAITLAFSIILTSITFLIYLNQKNKQMIQNRLIRLFVIMSLFLLLFQLIRYKLFNDVYAISNLSLFSSYGYVFLLLLIFPLYEVLCVEKDNFLLAVTKIGYIFIILKLLGWIDYNFLGNAKLFLFLDGDPKASRIIGSTILTKMPGTFLNGYLFAYSVTSILNKKSKLKNAVGIGILFFYAIFASQSRATVIIYTLVLLIAILYKLSSMQAINKVTMSLTFFILITILIILNWQTIVDFFSTFALNGEYGDSTAIRLYEQNYYFSLWKSNVIFGTGCLPEEIKIGNVSLYLIDMGIQIILYQFGIIGLFIDLIPFGVGISITIRGILKNRDSWLFQFILSLSSYYLISMLIFNPYDRVMYMLLPLYLCIILYMKKAENNI